VFFPTGGNFLYVTLIFKKGTRNNEEDYCGVATYYLQFRSVLNCWFIVYDDLKNLISVNQHGFMKNRSTVTKLLESASFVMISIEEGWQVDSIYMEFSKVFDRVRHELLLKEMAVGIEPA
jgi:hypothetical protein